MYIYISRSFNGLNSNVCTHFSVVLINLFYYGWKQKPIHKYSSWYISWQTTVALGYHLTETNHSLNDDIVCAYNRKASHCYHFSKKIGINLERFYTHLHNGITMPGKTFYIAEAGQCTPESGIQSDRSHTRTIQNTLKARENFWSLQQFMLLDF